MKRIISLLLLFLVISFLVSCSISPSTTISTTIATNSTTIATNPTKSLIPDVTSLESSFSTFYQTPISQSSLDALASIINTQGFTPKVSLEYYPKFVDGISCFLDYLGKTSDRASFELNCNEGNYLGYMIMKGIAKHPDFIAAFKFPELSTISYILMFDAKSQDQYANDVVLNGEIGYVFTPDVLAKVNWDNMDVNMKSNPAALSALAYLDGDKSYSNTDGESDSGAIWDYYGQ